MSGFPILDLVIGIIFVYFILGIICSSAIEIILTGMRARAKLLEEWLFKIFKKEVTQPDGTKVTLGQAIMDHCSTTALSKKGNSTQYIDAKNFTSALLEKVTFDPSNPKSIAKDIDELIAAIEKTDLLPTEFQRVLLTYANEAKDSFEVLTEKTTSKLELFRAKIENWFDSSMDRLTGALKKRYLRPATFVVAVVVTVSLNADSISLAKYLYANPQARAQLVSQATDATKDSAMITKVNAMRSDDTTAKGRLDVDEAKEEIKAKITELENAKQGLEDVLPLTWKKGELKKDFGSFRLGFSKITGLLVTILAIMMGAPFWFDLLNKLSNLRSTGAKPATSTGADDKNKDS